MQSLKCVYTQEVGADNIRLCQACGNAIPHDKRKDAKHCSRKCQEHSARSIESDLLKSLKVAIYNITFKYINRDRYIGKMGNYEGPLNKPITIIAKIHKDRGYHPMPRAVHIEPAEPRFQQVTPEDVNWCERQDNFRHSLTMRRKCNNFCCECSEVVIDENERKVRVTKGVYLPINHECGMIRVYNLHGKLLESIPNVQ